MANWDAEIILAIISGSVYLADMKMSVAAATLDYSVSPDGDARKRQHRPKIGGYYIPQNFPYELRNDQDYWTKVGVEEILHCFGVPEQHDENCFFHPPATEDTTSDQNQNDYCSSCLQFMLDLRQPFDR